MIECALESLYLIDYIKCALAIKFWRHFIAVHLQLPFHPKAGQDRTFSMTFKKNSLSLSLSLSLSSSVHKSMKNGFIIQLRNIYLPNIVSFHFTDNSWVWLWKITRDLFWHTTFHHSINIYIYMRVRVTLYLHI
jgi:hypothetical protein